MVAELVHDAHPLVSALASLESVLDAMDSAAYAGLDTETLVSVSSRLARVGARVTAQQAFAARVIDEQKIAKAKGATSTADFLGRAAGHDRYAGRNLLSTASAAPQGSRRETAFARGELTDKQTRIIGRAIDTLPTHTTQTQREHAESVLIRAAQDLSPKDLQARADRISDTFAPTPEVDTVENALVSERELAAREKTGFTMWDNSDGTWSGRFTLPEYEAATLKAAVDGYSSPRRIGLATDDAVREIPADRRQGLGFADLVSRLADAPLHGGTSATIVVTMSLESLTSTVDQAAHCSDGTRISAGRARQLACTAGIIPAVLDGDSIPLDVGTAQRVFTPAQRRALALRDEGCSFPGCDRPPGWTEAHHLTEWSRGGSTDIDNGALICFFHHHWIHERNAAGRISAHNRKPEYFISGRWKQHRRYRT